MAHSDSYIDPKLPLSIARVASVTGNPMLDVGWQCSDSRPYFMFSRTYTEGTLQKVETVYTTLSPNKSTSSSEVAVYKTENGSPVYAGSGAQNGTSLTFAGNAYTYSSNPGFYSFSTDKINKWSKCKPIRYNKVADLTDAERQGATYDQNEGYWYGVKISTPTTDYSTIHDVDFDYHRPRGGEYNEPYRLTDFCGYDHKAMANLYGVLLANSIISDEKIESIVDLTIDYAGNNTTGLDVLSSIVKVAAAGSIESAFSAVYAIVMIDHWASALAISDGSTTIEGTREIKPIYSDGAWHTRFSFRAYDLRELISGGLSTGEHTLSVFLVWGDHMLDKTGAWQDVSGGKLYDGRAFAMPNVTGLTVIVKEAVPTAPKATAGTLSATTTALAFMVNLASSSTSPVYVQATVRISSGTTNKSKTLSFPVGVTGAIFSFNWQNDFGMVVRQGQTVTGITITLTSWIDESKKTAGTGITNGSVTIQ